MAMQLSCVCMEYVFQRALALFQFSGFFDKSKDPEYGTTFLCKEGYQVKGTHARTAWLKQHPNVHMINMASKQLREQLGCGLGS